MQEVTEEFISNTNPFIVNYRDSLKRLRDANMQTLEQQRENDFAGIMSQANKAGMLYSNLPQRTKVQYDTNTYYPAVTKVQTGYQSGLDSLRQQGVDIANQIKSYQEAIKDMNDYTKLYQERAETK